MKMEYGVIVGIATDYDMPTETVENICEKSNGILELYENLESELKRMETNE